MTFFQNVLYKYMLEVNKFQESTRLQLYSVKQNIEG